MSGLPLNRAIYNENKEMIDIIAGTFLVVGIGDENFTSLSDSLQKKYADMFKNPEQFVKLNNEIVAVPIKPSVRRQLDLAKQNPQGKTEHQPKNKSEPEL